MPEPTVTTHTHHNSRQTQRLRSGVPDMPVQAYAQLTPPGPQPPLHGPVPTHRPSRPSRRRKLHRQNKGNAANDWIWVAVGAFFLGMTVLASLGVFVLLELVRDDQGGALASVPVIEPTSVLYGAGGILETTDADIPTGGMLGDGESMIIRPWTGQERFTVLLMGMDRRPGESGGAYRTDTIILLSLDPTTNRVGMLSIPRDLYVDVPGYGLQRVNTAYGLGEYAGAGGGPRLAMQTLQYNLGIRVNDYVVVDFNAFIRLVDLIGGIDVNVERAIYDPQYPNMNYGYDPFYLEAGMQHLDGATALKFARSRHGSDDIDRAARQQQVLYAVRDKLVSLDMIPQLALQAPALWLEYDQSVDTGLALDQILELALYLKNIPAQNFTNGVLGWQYVTPVNWQGQAILVPSRELIGSLMLEIFGPGYNQ